jgi:hypothetical protein
VDHVIPQALGGSDKPNNLVAACVDCNRGKTSISPDSKTVEDVSAHAFALADALQEKLEIKASQLNQIDEYQQSFVDYWYQVADDSGCAFSYPEKNWERTLEKWFAIGVPNKILHDAVDKAFRSKASQSEKYRYMCGIIWRTLDELQEDVLRDVQQPDGKHCGHCDVCLDAEHHEGEDCQFYSGEMEQDPTCNVCGNPDCLYGFGVVEGIRVTLAYTRKLRGESNGA